MKKCKGCGKFTSYYSDKKIRKVDSEKSKTSSKITSLFKNNEKKSSKIEKL